jgi:hypothetical protein
MSLMINLLKIPIIGAHVIAVDVSTIESFKSEYIYSIEKTSNEIYIPKNICTIKDKDLLVEQNFESIVNVCLDIKKPILLKRPVNSN